ncbi:MAG: NTP transferase domain-containing protein [bacterium]
MKEKTDTDTSRPGEHPTSCRIEIQQQDAPPITRAVILAAGQGNRLQSYQKGKPKPLITVGGLPLLKRTILSAKKVGITEFVIVVGYQADIIIKSVKPGDLGVKITWVYNADWQKPDGLSLSRAERFIDGPFLLFMADHIFDPHILKELKDIPVHRNCSVLCVDHDLSKVRNPGQSSKVRTRDNSVVDLGAKLQDFDAIAAGIIVCSARIFDALRKSQLGGDYSLLAGLRLLAKEGSIRSFDIGKHFWQDVNTESDAKHAERLLLHSTRSEGDGFIAKTINRKISNWITSGLLRTPIKPNHISIFNFCLSVFTAWIISFGKPLTTIIGGILFQLTSILDGCDGEVAKIKLQDSKFGALIDTITDHASYVIFIIGVTVGAFRATKSPVIFYVAGATLLFLMLALPVAFRYIKKKGSASLRELDQGIAGLNHASQKVWYLRFYGIVHHLGRRDLFSFVAAIIMLFGNITVFYWALMGSVNLMSSGILIPALALLSGTF